MGYLKNVLQSGVFLFLVFMLVNASDFLKTAEASAPENFRTQTAFVSSETYESDWFLIADSEGWTYLDDSPNVLRYFLEIPEITSDLLRSGRLQAFGALSGFGEDPRGSTLPTSKKIKSGNQSTKLEIRTDFVAGGVYLTATAFTTSTSAADNLDFFAENGPVSLKFRYVVMPKRTSEDLVLEEHGASGYPDTEIPFGRSK